MEDFFKKALEKKEIGTCTQSTQTKTPPPVLPITAAKTPSVFYETLFNRKSDKSPKHKTHFSQRESTKLEPQGLKITFSQMRMGKETSKFFSSWFRCPKISRANSLILYSCPDSTHKKSPVLSWAPLKPDKRHWFLTLTPNLEMACQNG